MWIYVVIKPLMGSCVMSILIRMWILNDVAVRRVKRGHMCRRVNVSLVIIATVAIDK